MDRISYFDSFYNENKDKIYMKKNVNYPINYKKATEWIKSQCDIESSDFADKIIRNTRHVSFGEFMDKLVKISTSYIESYKDDDSIFILIIPYEISKSNIWVTLLVYKYIKEIVSDIHYDVTAVYNMTLDSKSKLYRKKIRCIVCDDCAYTGSQMEYTAQLDNLQLDYNNKKSQPDVNNKEWLEWYDKTISDANSIIQNISIDNFSIDLIIPYMSTLSLDKLLKIPYVKIPKDVTVFPIFKDQVNMSNIPIDIVNEFKYTFQYHKDISALYFDHKIADAVSTFNKIYYLSPLFNCTINNASISFIEGCETQVPDDIDIYNQYIAVENSTNNELCPSTFYKSVDYTFKKKKIDKNSTINEILN